MQRIQFVASVEIRYSSALSSKVGGDNFQDIHLSDQMCKLVCTSLITSSSTHFLLSTGRSSFICRAGSCKQAYTKRIL